MTDLPATENEVRFTEDQGLCQKTIKSERLAKEEWARIAQGNNYRLLFSKKELQSTISNSGLIVLTVLVFVFCAVFVKLFLCAQQNNVSIQNKSKMFGKAELKKNPCSV